MKKLAHIGLIIVLSLFDVFHILVLTGIIPYTMIWGGRLHDINEMYRMETVSVILNTYFLVIILIDAGLLKLNWPAKLIRYSIIGMALLFLLNTLGNLFSENRLETLLFTPITLVLAALSLVLVIKKN